MRKRINLMAAASSNDYEAFRRAKRNMLITSHEQHAEEVKAISDAIHTLKPYTMVFGNLIPLTDVEAATLKVTIIWK